jgi:hypothetical protein
MNVSHLNRQPGEKFHNWARRVQGEYIDLQTFSEWRGIHEHRRPNSIAMVKEFIQEISSYYENGALMPRFNTCFGCGIELGNFFTDRCKRCEEELCSMCKYPSLPQPKYYIILMYGRNALYNYIKYYLGRKNKSKICLDCIPKICPFLLIQHSWRHYKARKDAAIKIQRIVLQWLYRPGSSLMKKAETHFYKTVC